jgi:hypothetical protein
MKSRTKSSIELQQSTKKEDPKQNELIENKSRNMHGRDKKEEHEGEKECRVSKAVPESSEQLMKQCTSFLKSKMPEASCYRNIRGLYTAMNGHKA